MDRMNLSSPRTKKPPRFLSRGLLGRDSGIRFEEAARGEKHCNIKSINANPSDSFPLTSLPLQERYVPFGHSPACKYRAYEDPLTGHPSAQGGNSTAQGRDVQASKRVKLQRPDSGCSRMSPIMAPESRLPYFLIGVGGLCG